MFVHKHAPMVILMIILAFSMILSQWLGLKWLAWDRGQLQAGEVWRLYSGHFVHLGLWHLTLNLLALGLLSVLFAEELGWRSWMLVLGLLPPFISAGLWWGMPSLQGYAGLSGVLHGVFVLGAIRMWSNPPDRALSATLLVLVLVKLWLEPGSAESGVTASLIGGRILVEAHQWGAAGGVAIACVMRCQPSGSHAGSV